MTLVELNINKHFRIFRPGHRRKIGPFTACTPDIQLLVSSARNIGPCNLLSSGYRELFPRGKAAGAWRWPLTSI